jgi:hypothetical protein
MNKMLFHNESVASIGNQIITTYSKIGDLHYLWKYWRDKLFLLTEGTVTARVLSSRNRRKKEDRIGERQPFRERTLSLQDKICPGREWNLAFTRQTSYPPNELG